MSTLYRPAPIGLLLDRALGVYRLHWRAVMGAALAVLFPAALLATIAQVFSQRELAAIFSALASNDSRAFLAAQGGGWAPVIQLTGTVGSVVWLAANAWVYTGVLACAPEMAEGRPVTTRRILSAPGSRYWTVIALTVVTAMVLFVPVAGLVVAVFWLLAIPVAVVEGAAFDRAFARSWRLVSRAGFWRTVLFWMALGLIVFALEQVALAPNVLRQAFQALLDTGSLFQPMSVEWTVFAGVLAAVGLAFAAPFSMLAMYLYYADARARAEGMDLVQQARALAAGTAAPDIAASGPVDGAGA